MLGAGPHEARWDGRDDFGSAVSSGTYFARLASSETKSFRKLVRVR